jgi:Sec-independent protein translocase protein TatA
MGIELLLGLGLGFLLLGPKRMHAMAGYLSRTKAQLAKAGRGLQSELEAELGRESPGELPPAADQIN